MLKKFIVGAQIALSWFSLVAALLTVIVVVGSYIVSAMQPYRGPTLFYFYILFVAALISKKWSTAMLIFALPLLPSLASQFEYVWNPRVKYFVSYPGVDAIVGLFLGKFCRSILIDRDICKWLRPPPWPFGFALLLVAISCCITIDRNLWQSASAFSWFGLLNSVFRFKHVLYGNAFAPFNDFLVYSIVVLVVICLSQALQDSKNRDAVVFKPLVCGLIVSAGWAVMQATTGFGLPESVIVHRAGTFGYGAFGFQPDIHAFAAHMLVGAVGLFGYMAVSSTDMSHVLKLRWSQVVVVACIASWIALIFSKSRASLIFATIVLIIWVGIYIRAKQERLPTKRVLFLIGSLVLTGMSLSFSEKFWLADTIREIRSSNLMDFEVLNKISTYRLEIFRGTLQMFWHFPLMGIGQANFFHLSSNFDFMGSVWVAQAGGENAHNYFLQTLAELGLIGTFSFLLVFLWPLKNCSELKKLIPVIGAIIAMFLGNLYSHSLIIRENLYFLAVFVALLYAHCDKITTDVSTRMTDSTDSVASADADIALRRQRYIRIGLLVCAIGLGYFAYREVSTAKNKFPFVYGSDCYKPTTAFTDGWSSGRLILPLTAGKSGVRLEVDQNQHDAKRFPPNISLTIVDQSGRLAHSVDYLAQDLDEFSMQIAIPEMTKKEFQGGSVVMQLSKCFSPSNFGLNDDSRKLGVHLKSIEQF